jgi:hypothetical protein
MGQLLIGYLLEQYMIKTIRNYCGGEMGKVFMEKKICQCMKQFVFDRTGSFRTIKHTQKRFGKQMQRKIVTRRVKIGSGTSIIHKIH